MKRLAGSFLAIVISSALVSFEGYAQFDPGYGINGQFFYQVNGTSEFLVSSIMLPDSKTLNLFSRAIAVNQVTYRLVRVNSNGTLDTTYGTNGEAEIIFPGAHRPTITHAFRRSDGKIILLATDTVIRINEDATFDTTFSSDGMDIPNNDPFGFENVTAAVALPDGKLIVAGTSTITDPFSTKVFLIKYNADGTLDSSFGGGSGFVFRPTGSRDVVGIGRQSSGKLVAVFSGQFVSSKNVVRFNADGTLDGGFAGLLLPGNEAKRLLIAADDKVIVVGDRSFRDTTFRLDSDFILRRLGADGELDASWGSGGILTVDASGRMEETLQDVVLSPDGSVAVAGLFWMSPNRTHGAGFHQNVARIAANGEVTGRYIVNAGGGGFDYVNRLAVQPDGKVVSISTILVGAADRDIMFIRLTSVPLTTYRFRALPFQFSVNSVSENQIQGRSMKSVFRPGENSWWADVNLRGIVHGIAGDIIAPSDYHGSYSTDLAVFRPSSGSWHIYPNFSGGVGGQTIQWGLAGDIPVPYDYEGDGKSDVAVFRPSDGTWYIRHGSDASQRIQRWGVNGDKPVTGDYDGDGLGDIAVWRPSTGVWYILRSSDGQAMFATFGLSTDIPVQEDYDGDLKTDIAVWRPSTGVWYIWRSGDGGFTIETFGLNGDVPVPGDYDGDRKMDISIFRTGRWYHLLSTIGYQEYPYGLTTDIPMPGRY